jgi:hypothetical protein
MQYGTARSNYKNGAMRLYSLGRLSRLAQGPYTETIDHCFEPFFVKEIMHAID